MRLARSGREMKIRKIAGLEAVDEAVGRATEMGRPILFVPGIQDISDIDEFGTHATPDGFRALYEMSSYHHVMNGTAYPAALLMHGDYLPSAAPWQSTKMTARLQAATRSDRPVLLRFDEKLSDTSGTVFVEKAADVYSFLLWQLGVDGFSPERHANPID